MGETQNSDDRAREDDAADVERAGADADDVYNPTAVQVTRGREQGLGMGARDLQMQRDVYVEQTDSDLERAVAPTNHALNSPQAGRDGDERSNAETDTPADRSA